MNTMHFTQLTSVKKENVYPDCTWDQDLTILVPRANKSKQAQTEDSPSSFKLLPDDKSTS